MIEDAPVARFSMSNEQSLRHDAYHYSPVSTVDSLNPSIDNEINHLFASRTSRLGMEQ